MSIPRRASARPTTATPRAAARRTAPAAPATTAARRPRTWAAAWASPAAARRAAPARASTSTPRTTPDGARPPRRGALRRALGRQPRRRDHADLRAHDPREAETSARTYAQTFG